MNRSFLEDPEGTGMSFCSERRERYSTETFTTLFSEPQSRVRKRSDMTEQAKKYETLLPHMGQRRTVQRQLLLQVLEEAEGHLTIEQLTDRIRSISPPVSLSTIYRNVELFTDRGLVRSNHLSSEGNTYELADEKLHVHLVCQSCHSVTHLEMRQLETLQANLLKMTPFHVASLALTVTGYCTSCWHHLSSEKTRKREA
jgi:Fur family ferric uptake transcriptional regulator